MIIRHAFRLICLIGVLGVAAWLLRDTPPLRALTGQLRGSAAAQWIDEQAAALGGTGRPDAAGRSRAAGTLRKCVDGERIVYTNADCPAGSRAQAIDGGTVSVLPPTPVPAPAPRPEAPASGGLLSELAGVKPGEPTLREKAVDQIR